MRYKCGAIDLTTYSHGKKAGERYEDDERTYYCMVSDSINTSQKRHIGLSRFSCGIGSHKVIAGRKKDSDQTERGPRQRSDMS